MGDLLVVLITDSGPMDSGNPMGSCKRQVCECDRVFAAAVQNAQYNAEIANGNSAEYCTRPSTGGGKTGDGQCCNNGQDVFSWYNANNHSCCSDGQIRAIGSC